MKKDWNLNSMVSTLKRTVKEIWLSEHEFKQTYRQVWTMVISTYDHWLISNNIYALKESLNTGCLKEWH